MGSWLYSLSAHPAAALFPLLREPELAELAADIKAHGLRLPIVTYRGEILDGRNRLSACELAGVPPRFEEYAGDDPIGYAIGVNLHRRHLSESQRAMVAARVRAAGTNWSPGRTADATAELLNVGPTSVKRAHLVLSRGVPELAQAVDRGEVAVSAAAVLVDAPPEEQRELVARGEREILARAAELRARKVEQRRAERFARLAEISRGDAPLSDTVAGRRWPIILADPPWRHEHSSESRATENHYPTMALEDICALPVSEIATPAAVLFLWAPVPKLEEATRVIAAWGFRYRTALVWVKNRIGLGQYVRQRAEALLLAVRGDMPAPSPSNRPDSVLETPLREHSRKPDEAYGVIERMYPGLAKVELFARRRWQGWDVWGNQAPAEQQALEPLEAGR